MQKSDLSSIPYARLQASEEEKGEKVSKKKLVAELYKERENRQEALFENPLQWQEEWQGMPEFIQPPTDPYKQIIVRFATKEDYEDFCKVIGQELSPNCKSIWHPSLLRGSFTHMRYTDENVENSSDSDHRASASRDAGKDEQGDPQSPEDSLPFWP